MFYILLFFVSYFIIKAILDTIDHTRNPEYYQKLQRYKDAVMELSARLQKVLEYSDTENAERDYKPVSDLAIAMLIHAVPSKKELKENSPVTIFYKNFGKLIEEVREYKGWSDKPVLNQGKQ